MKNIYVVTHTESIHHIQGLAGGWYDTSLTENGKNQARKIAIGLHNEIGVQNIPIGLHPYDWTNRVRRVRRVNSLFS